ncbi:hypothetical protein ACHAXA_005738 [Cyclostephanos tholiformis]|uniref:protein-serine/threonine phosphatase n=1 Tax=Cyclostephanos tholiformis TaxID=382380 RepID=A0ABD3R6D9_9STRA
MISPNEAIPVRLPIPPAAPYLPTDPVAARALAALSDEVMPTSLDVHIRWAIESGNIVHKGEKIAQLFYTFHGMPPPLPSSTSSTANTGNGIIRARRRRNDDMRVYQQETSNGTNSNNDALPKEVVSVEIRSPSNGFLRVLFKKKCASNVVRINQTSVRPELSVINLILAAIEPCEHPAVVGGLCVVCGADMRTPADGKVQMENPIQRGQNLYQAQRDNKGTKPFSSQGNMQEPVDIRKQEIIDKQKKLSASMASSSELDNEVDDEELANLDIDAAVSIHASASSNTKNLIPKKTKSASQPTAARSLSSLLSGARATHKLQELPNQQQPSHRHTRKSVINLSSNVIDDSQMTKMTVSGGVTIAISKSEARNISEDSSKKLREEKKLCLVLDLDHTLLHATDDYRAGRFVADKVFVGHNNSDENETGHDKTSLVCNPKSNPEKRGYVRSILQAFESPPPQQQEYTQQMTKPNPAKRDDVRSILLPFELPPPMQQSYIQQKLQQQSLEETKFCLSPLPQQMQGANACMIVRHFIKLRPHLKEFFSQIQSTYQLSVYTAGTRSYAEQVAVMICRHLVGASLDEEDLNNLRMKVREKDEECRRFEGRVGRKRQLILAEKMEPALKLDASKSASKKSVSFRGSAYKKVDNETDVDVEDKNCAPNFLANEPNRLTESDTTHTLKITKAGDDVMHVPKRKNPGKDELVDESRSADVDPTHERNRLRKELEEAEKLEIKALDLRRKMFGSRIVSRTDVYDLGISVKSLNRVFPCGGVMAAILDDREDVWANAKNNVTGRPGEPPDNLLLVKPYHWEPFLGYADVNNASGQDLSTKEDAKHLAGGKIDEKEDDSQLLWTADILRRLHERYYSTALSNDEKERATVPSLLQAMRKETLSVPQVKIVFSGLIPINEQNKQSKTRPHVVRYAEELGAEVLPAVSREVTHIVAAKDQSEKIKHARKNFPGCVIVHTSWLMECFWSLTRRDVKPHHMGSLPSQHAKQDTANGTVNGFLFGNSSEEESVENDSDDGFVEDLEKEMIMRGQ